MPTRECRALIARERLARLGCSRDNQPYIVPIYYIFAESQFFSFSMAGQKIDYMRTNPNVCLEIERFHQNRRWKSVIISGTFTELTQKAERQQAWEILKVYNDWWEQGGFEAISNTEHMQQAPIYFTISINEMTGREATPQ
nr:pyridoxamine 5'-phosphate oxidase family protein [Rhizobium setariae]